MDRPFRSVAWSPDGDQIAYTTDKHSIDFIASDGSSHRSVSQFGWGPRNIDWQPVFPPLKCASDQAEHATTRALPQTDARSESRLMTLFSTNVIKIVWNSAAPAGAGHVYSKFGSAYTKLDADGSAGAELASTAVVC
jgi:hypothetical protein